MIRPLGFVTAIVPDMNLESVMQLASRIGYQCLEVCCWPPGKASRRYAGITHINVLDYDAGQIKDVCARHEISISSLGYYPNALSPDAEESSTAVEHIRTVVAASAELGIGKMTTFIGRDWTKNVDENWPRFLETWRPIIQEAEDLGVQIGIENCPMLFTADEWPGGKNLAHSPAIWRRMFEDIPNPNFGLNYDPSHMVFQQMDYLAPLREFADRIFHVHAKDVRVDTEKLNDVGTLAFPNLYHTPKLPGMGDVDWGKFFSTLTCTGYTGPVCVEVEDRAYEGSDETIELSLRQSHTFLRNYLPKNA
ncbi:sugar phosphate isomerase/epimerase family protein [Crateriforma conspicua]|uniref:sugar phosphate isomerase/epimerase family protein n=1 Tax=Crateriforma conspicua TaxID=2527996 RepID=UPI0011A9D596|nr:sugar phosphate isomerase/epimerase family protein [Crateriforma conspicua]